MLYRLATILVVAGCGRLKFGEVPADASLDTAPALALACNTPVKLADAPLGTHLNVVATRSSIFAGWIDPSGQLDIGHVSFPAVDQVTAFITADAGDMNYTAISAAASADLVVSAYTRAGTSYIEVLDADLQTIGFSPSPVSVLTTRSVAMTGNVGDPIAAVTGNDAMANLAELVPVNADGTLGTPVNSGNVNAASSIVNIGDRLAVIDIPPANNCEIKTADLAVTSRTTTVGWGTDGQCSQGMLGYSPGRGDALLVRHDLVDGDINHVIATRSGLNYTIPGESRLRNPANEGRPVGVADGYWVSYETGGTLEAVHLDVAATVGPPVVLGPLSDPTLHGTVVKDGEAYVIWLQDGLELAHLCP